MHLWIVQLAPTQLVHLAQMVLLVRSVGMGWKPPEARHLLWVPPPLLHHPHHHHHDQLDPGWPQEALEGPGVQVKWGGQGAKLGRSSTKNCRPAAALAATAAPRTPLVDYLSLSFQRHFQFDPFYHDYPSFFTEKNLMIVVCVYSRVQQL